AGALVLSCVMTGALVAHVTVLRMSPAVPVVLLALLVPLAWRGRADVARLLRPAPRPAVRRRRRVSGLTTADRRHSGWPGGRASGAAGRV
ncbi:MAG TPA: hypothetical protein VKA84_09720, partial [Gemmatimonadaceae bacterium]|nr:hypothetical protein [Gemmatimonadaceae bacterium]